ncbi:MAG: histidine kinase, partial [Oscillospiraceae bacterium]
NEGLNVETAQKVAEIIYNISDVSAVTITNMEQVLAYIGADCEEHPTIGMPIITESAYDVLRTGELRVVHNKSGLHCEKNGYNCPLESTVIAPLILNDKIIGTVKLYHPAKDEVPEYVLKLAIGAAQLLSMQVELAEKDRQQQLMVEAQLDALRARINPHFLFNTLNTIGVLIRTDPEKARELLLNFSAFFRNSLKTSSHFVTLAQELENINNYIVLEQARFGDKLNIQMSLEPQLMDAIVPVLSIQPLVENAIVHGITPKESNGTVRVKAYSLGEEEIEIVVSDDGIGIKEDILTLVREKKYNSSSGAGVGLNNVDERLKILFGKDSGIKINSRHGEGTTVSFTIKKRFDSKKEGEQ